MQTILHINNPHVEAFRTAGASLTKLLNDHYVSNYTLADVQARTDLDPELLAINIDPIIPEGESPEVPAIEFDAAEDVIQEMNNATYHQLRKEQPGLFPAPVVEADPEPRYKRVLSARELKDKLLLPEKPKIIDLVSSDPIYRDKWDTVLAGPFDFDTQDPEDQQAQAEMWALFLAESVCTPERLEVIKKGLPIA